MMSVLSETTIQHLIQDYGLWIVFIVVMSESMGVPLPGETTLVAAGIYAGSTQGIDPYLLVAVAAAAAVLGDNIGYVLGRTIGLRLLLRYGRYVNLTEARLKLGRYLFLRHGGKIVFIGRFVALLRVLTAVLAGVDQMPWPRFLLFNACGGICWAVVFGFGAYLFGEKVRSVSGPIAIAIVSIAVTFVLVGVLYLRRNEEELQRLAEQTFPGPLRQAWPQSPGR
jgi:membrane protein DedA with SNARE-associated domain